MFRKHHPRIAALSRTGAVLACAAALVAPAQASLADQTSTKNDSSTTSELSRTTDGKETPQVKELLPESDVLKSPELGAKPPVTGGENPGATLGQGVKSLQSTDNISDASEQLLQKKVEQAKDGKDVVPKPTVTAPGATSASAQRSSSVSGTLKVTTALETAQNTAASVNTASWAPASGVQGMDVSGWQPSVNWASEYNNGSRFAYIKVSEGSTYTSPNFSDQYSGADSSGMYRGGYHFALPSQSSGAVQANYFVNNGGGWTADGRTLPGLLDIEYNPYGSLGDACYGMYGSTMTNWIKDFANTYKSRTGRFPAIYSTTDWLNSCGVDTQSINNLPLHIASYNGQSTPGTLPNGWTTHDIWQYSAEGPFSGDSNLYNGTAAQLRSFVTSASYRPKGGAAAPQATTPTVRGAIGNYYRANGGSGVFGTPLATEKGNLNSGGALQKFSKNRNIYWSAYTGANPVITSGAIGAKFRAAGSENGIGYPTTYEHSTGSTAWQTFYNPTTGKRATIVWSSGTGAHIVQAGTGIGNAWAAAGSQQGYGYPVTDETSAAGGVSQVFVKNGKRTFLGWTSSAGTHRVNESSGLGAAWVRAGRENGWGYPVTEEYKSGNTVKQRYSRGVTATWTTQGKVTTSR